MIDTAEGVQACINVDHDALDRFSLLLLLLLIYLLLPWL